VVYAGVADFTAAPASGAAPLSVHFTDRSDVPAATTHLWDFGDGTTSHEVNPTHVYAAPGGYNVKLVVTGINGEVEVVKNNVVSVSAASAATAAGGVEGAAAVVPARDAHRPSKRTGVTSLLTEQG
jgi:PKD repeat protein